MDEPTLPAPYTENELPILTKCLSETPLAMWQKSRIDKVDPSLAAP
jgi:hypothetical protein